MSHGTVFVLFTVCYIYSNYTDRLFTIQKTLTQFYFEIEKVSHNKKAGENCAFFFVNSIFSLNKDTNIYFHMLCLIHK